MENIDYNDIIQYINQVIIGQRIKYFSTIKKGRLIGGSSTVEIEHKKISTPIIIGILQAFRLDPSKDLGKKIYESIILNNTIITALTLITSVIGILSGLTQIGAGPIDNSSLLALSGIIGITLLSFSGLGNITTEISKGFKKITSMTTNIIGILRGLEGAFNGFSTLTTSFSHGGGELDGGQFIIDAAQGIKQFGSFIYYLCKEMLTRPILASAIKTVKSLFSSSNPESINTSSPLGFFDELKSAFVAAWIQSSSKNKSRSTVSGSTISDSTISDKEILSQFIWDENSSNIKYIGTSIFSKITTELSSSTKIQMEIKYETNIPIYKIDLIESSSKSLILGKQIPTALVICYMQDRSRTKPPISRINTSEYSFSISPAGTSVVSLYKNGKEVSTITRAVQAQLANHPESKNYIKEVCVNLFGLDKGDQDPICASYFYSAIGSSVEGILKTLGDVTHDIYRQIMLAELPILYDMIKRLGWETRMTLTNKYELITVDEWIVTSGKRFSEYIESNPKVKSLLEHIIEKINSNPEFLNLKYKLESVESLPKRRHRPKSNIIVSHLITLGDTLNLNKSVHKVMEGGSKTKNTHKLESKYLGLISNLRSIGQKLSLVTDTEIKGKIEKIIKLEKEIEQINMKILSYVKLLKNNRNARVLGKIINLDEIDSMLAQQSRLSLNHNKYITVLTSAFGKLQFVVDSKGLANQSNFYFSI